MNLQCVFIGCLLVENSVCKDPYILPLIVKNTVPIFIILMSVSQLDIGSKVSEVHNSVNQRFNNMGKEFAVIKT